MKKTLLLMLLCITISSIAIAQPNITWSKTFGGNTDDFATCVVPIGDQYIVGGYSRDKETSERKANIFLMDNKGKRVWNKFYINKKERTEITHVLISKDKKHIIAAARVNPTNRKPIFIRILKLDLEGNVVWSSEVSDRKEWIYCNSIVENMDNDIMLCYDKEIDKELNYRIEITKINAQGEIKWSEIVEHDVDDDPIGMKMIPFTNQFILVSEASGPKASDGRFLIRTLNNNGKVLSTKPLDWLNVKNYIIDNFAIDALGNIILCGDNMKEDDSHAAIFLIDKEGNKIMETSWMYGIIPNIANDVAFDTDGNILIVGAIHHDLSLESDEDWDMWVSKFDLEGDCMWSKEIGGTYRDEANSVAIGRKGQLIVVGQTSYEENGEKDVSIVELVEDGKGIVSKIPPKVWAVIVGVSDYSDDQNKSGWGDLRFCDDDATHLKNFLQSPKGGKLPDEQVKFLLNDEATRANILAAADELYMKANPNDLIIFYFSGHGGPNIFAGHDGSVSHTELKKIIAASGVNKRLCIADACYSGTFNSEDVKERRKLTEDEMNQKYYDHLGRTSQGMALFMSSASNETSLEMGSLQQGAFTYHYVEGLKGAADANGDKIITVSELYKYVSEKVATTTYDHQHPQLRGIFDHDMPVGVTH